MCSARFIRMEKIARADWKRHSAPYDLATTSNQPTVTELCDQAMQAFIASSQRPNIETQTQKSATLGRARKKSMSLLKPEKAELSTDLSVPGVLRVYGETVLPGVQYKSVLASCRSTAQELVKQALERFGLSKTDYTNYVLCEVVGRYDTLENVDVSTGCVKGAKMEGYKWDPMYATVLSDNDRPLMLQQFWRPTDGYQRRYELRERTRVPTDNNTDDTSGLNDNARKILISKLRPGAIPLFDASRMSQRSSGLQTTNCQKANISATESEMTARKGKPGKVCTHENNAPVPLKNPYFLSLRGFDVRRDKTTYVIKFKRFNIGNPHYKTQLDRQTDDVPMISIFAPDINAIHCSIKVYTFKKSNGSRNPASERNNYFLELEPLGDNVSVNGNLVNGKVLVKSGDVINLGLYYAFLFKDCSKGFDIPLSLPWLPVPSTSRASDDSEAESVDSKIGTLSLTDTDDSLSASSQGKLTFIYSKHHEVEQIEYICAIIKQTDSTQTYALTVAFLFSMCIEHVSLKFEGRHLKHLFQRIMDNIRENVLETTQCLNDGDFKCSLFEPTSTESDGKLERLLLYLSNCVHLMLFLKNSFQLDHHIVHTDERTNRADDGVQLALEQFIAGLEETILFCFQKCVYTITRAIHPILPALLSSNPFNDKNSEQCVMNDIIHLLDTLAEMTLTAMLHEGITRQLFTYLFFFTNTHVFNTVMNDSWTKYYNWQCGIRIRANLSELEDWATGNGLDDEFGQMFQRLLTFTELLATSKNTLMKYDWRLMRCHFLPLTPGQLHHVLSNYQLGKPVPDIWTPTQEDYQHIQYGGTCSLPLTSYPAFILPETCGAVDLVRLPDDTGFLYHLQRLNTLYGTSNEENGTNTSTDDSDSGFSRSNTPRDSCAVTEDPFYVQAGDIHNRTSSSDEFQTNTASLLNNPKAKKLALKKLNGHARSLQLPVKISCHRKPSMSDKNVDLSGNALYSYLMEVENRENSFNIDNEQMDSPETKVRLIRPNHTLDHNVQEQRAKSGNIYVKKTNQTDSSRVSNCSARPLQRSLQLKTQRSIIQGQRSQPPETKVNFRQSFPCAADPPQRFLRCHPSASFEEAIERGYSSDPMNHTDEHDDNLQGPGCSRTKAKDVTIPLTSSSLSISNGTSVFNNNVYVDEDGVKSVYEYSENNIDSPPYNQSSKYFKSLSTSECNLEQRSTHKLNNAKLTTVSFTPNTRRSSIELTQDKLLLYDAEQEVQDLSDTDNEQLPGELFTVVNERTLEYLKRHGSSLNVAPSEESSPVTVQRECTAEVLEVLEGEDNLPSPPRPFYTVQLHKQDGGLGLALIDGLHTDLHLSGIYVRKILPDSPVANVGCIHVGDRILAVDGKNIKDASYHSVLKTIKEAGDSLTLTLAQGNESMASKLSASQV